MPKILLTSVCGPIGREYGDAPSVGYELLYRQVTRAQGVFSPRAVHLHFALEYIAENLDCPAVTLQYPRKEDLIRELRRGDYDYVGITFILALFHRLKETVALIREHAPHAKIVLGGYGTVLSDEELAPYADHICREEGVAYFRRLLGQPPLPMPYSHPLVISRLKLFSLPVSRTGMIFAGLGCANGCDFCSTSHFFKRKHIKLLADGKDIYRVVERYLETDPGLSFVVLDEDFLLNKRRAMEFRDCVQKAGRPISMFVFASMRAISQYTPQEIVEMGIDGFWIGYEGTRSGYAKQMGRPPRELFADLRRHGITVLASMIVGFDYQDEDVVREELDGLLRLRPCLSQFLIYGPILGTPFYDRVAGEGRLHENLVTDRATYYKSCDGFKAMVKHPRLSAERIEAMQQACFKKDFARLGPSIYRVTERWLEGWRTFKDSPSPYLRAKAERFAADARNAYPSLLVGRALGPNRRARRRVAALEARCRAWLGAPTMAQRAAGLVALVGALWTAVCMRFGWFQIPACQRTAYRCPEESWAPHQALAQACASLREGGFAVELDVRHLRREVCLRIEGALSMDDVEALRRSLESAIRRGRSRLLLDFRRVRCEEGVVEAMREALLSVHQGVRLALPAGTP